MIKEACYANRIQQRIKNDKEALRTKIYNALKDLKENERKLVELRYLSMDKRTWLDIGLELGFDKNYCQKLRNDIINQLIDIIFP